MAMITAAVSVAIEAWRRDPGHTRRAGDPDGQAIDDRRLAGPVERYHHHQAGR